MTTALITLLARRVAVLLISPVLVLLSGCCGTQSMLSARGQNPHVVLETEVGNIEVELYAVRAPITVSNFLNYVRGGYFTGGSFFRTVTPENQPTNRIKIQVIQAQANPAREKDFFPPIPLERTRDTGIRHLDGTLSMARDTPDSAQDSFSICVGNQPALDCGGLRNPDGQGFAAFGRVVKGRKVVHRIHASPYEVQALHPPILIRRAFVQGEEAVPVR